MRRGQKTNAEQIVLKLRQSKVQTAFVTSAYARRSSTR